MYAITCQEYLATVHNVEESEIISTTNELYEIINNEVQVKTANYRCYIKNETLTICFLIDNIQINQQLLSKKIRNSHLGLYGITRVYIKLYDETCNVKIEQKSTSTQPHLKSQ